MFVSYILSKVGINWVSAYVPGREAHSAGNVVACDSEDCREKEVECTNLVSVAHPSSHSFLTHIGYGSTSLALEFSHALECGAFSTETRLVHSTSL